MAKLLDFVVRCSTASAGDVIDDLVRMADPNSFDSRDEMEGHFEDCLGYNPMEYFDRKTIDEQYDYIIKEAPYSVQTQLRDKRDEIIGRTLECSKDVSDTVLHKVFISVVKDVIGWQPIEDSDVSLDDCISMAIFGNDDIDDPDEYDDEDDGEDDYDILDDDDEMYDDTLSDD